MTDTIPARLAALKSTPTRQLKAQWRELFDSEPPPLFRTAVLMDSGMLFKSPSNSSMLLAARSG